MQIKISDLELLLNDYYQQVGQVFSFITKYQTPLKQLRRFLHKFKQGNSQDRLLTESELFRLARWLIEIKKPEDKATKVLIKNIVTLYGELFLRVFKQIYLFYPENPRLQNIFSHLIKQANQIKVLSELIIFLVQINQFKFEQLEFIIFYRTEWEDIFSLLNFFHSKQKLTNDTVQSIICSADAGKILSALETSKDENALQLLKSKEDFSRLCEYGDYANDFVALYLLMLNYPLQMSHFKQLKDPGLMKSIFDACASLKQNHYGSEDEDFALIFSCPEQAHTISVLLTSFRSRSMFEVNEKLRELIKDNATHLDKVCGVIAVLFEKKIHHQVGVEKIFQYANCAKVIAEVLKQINKEDLLNQLDDIFPNAKSQNTAFTRAINIFSEANISKPEYVAIICKHKQDADLYAETLVASHLAELLDSTLLQLIDGNKIIARIVSILFRANFADKNTLLALFRPQKTAQIDLPFTSKTLVQNFVTTLENIDHPFCHFVLGKIYCGEMWGVDMHYSPEKAIQHFSAISANHPFYAESRYSLYNINLNNTDRLDNTARSQRLRLAMQLQKHQHPFAKVVRSSLKTFSEDYVKSWYFSQFPMLLFKTINLPIFNSKISHQRRNLINESGNKDDVSCQRKLASKNLFGK